jgi:hypothetical protein
MKLFESRILWGGLLILAGIFFLFQNLGYLRLGDIFWVILFTMAGIFFLTLYFQYRNNWWSLVPGMTMLSLGLLVLLNWIAPELGDFWGGSIVLAGIGIGFLLIYLIERQNWWAIIPAGVLFTLALVAGLDEFTQGLATAGIFFSGIGLTFAMLAILPTPQGEMRWAWIPGGILLLFGGIFLVAGENLLAYLFPFAMVIIGGYLILRSFRSR